MVKIEEHQVMLMVEQQKISFLLNIGACFSALLFSPRPRSPNKVTVQGILGQPLEHYLIQPLVYSWRDLHFCHSFLIVSKTPVPFWGQDLLSQLKVQPFLPPGEYCCMLLIESQVDPAVCTDG
jgi:hypothetical protein